MPTHGECINYVDGRCTLYNIPVDPNSPACPNFRPKTVARPPTTVSPMAGAPSPAPTPIPFMGGRRHRHRRRRRWRWGWKFW